MKFICKLQKFGFLGVCVLLTAAAIAQAPEAFNYQAVVRDGAGELVTNAPVGVQISILQGSASGTAVYTETHTPTSNANGLVTLHIGEGVPATGVFGSINWSNGPYFVETSTDPIGGTNYSVSSVSQFLSVPYALYAEVAGDDGDWINEETYLSTDKNVGIGTEAPSVALEVNGDIKAHNLLQTASLQSHLSTANGLMIAGTSSSTSTNLVFQNFDSGQNTDNSILDVNPDGAVVIKKPGTVEIDATILAAVSGSAVIEFYVDGVLRSRSVGFSANFGSHAAIKGTLVWRTTEPNSTIDIRVIPGQISQILGLGLLYNSLSVKWTGTL